MGARKSCWWWHLWPGLVQIFNGREWDGLVRAVAFAVFLNGAVFATLVWGDVVSETLRRGLWGAVVIFWAGSAAETLWWLARQGRLPQGERDRLYREATVALLQRQWQRAHDLLNQLLRYDPTDAEAALLMAVATYQLGDAARAHLYLDRCRTVGGAKWAWEVEHLARRVLVGPGLAGRSGGVTADNAEAYD